MLCYIYFRLIILPCIPCLGHQHLEGWLLFFYSITLKTPRKKNRERLSCSVKWFVAIFSQKMNVFRGLLFAQGLFLLWPPGSVDSIYLRPEIERPQTPSPGLIRPSDKLRDSRRQPQSFGEHQSSHGVSTRANSTNSLHVVSSVYYDLSSRTRIKIFLRICKSYMGM